MSKTPETTLPAFGGAGGPSSGSSSGPPKTKKTAIPAARKAAAAAPLPEPEDDGAPSAAAYRLKEEDIDHSVCVGRVLKGGKDKRWKPVVYREFQCGKAMEDDCDLCKVCQNRLGKYAEEPKPGDWTGRITEEPPSWLHMLGTEWAEVRKPKWLGAAATDSGSDASSTASKASKAAEKEAAKAKKDADKAVRVAEKEAAKATKEAIKRAKNEEKAAAKASKVAAPSIMVEEAPAPAVDPRDAIIATLTAERAALLAQIADLKTTVRVLRTF